MATHAAVSMDRANSVGVYSFGPMARIRTIKPELFRHYELWECEFSTGLPIIRCWCALLTVCDREGRFKWRPRILKLDCAPFDDIEFEDVLKALEGIGLVCSYEVDGEHYGVVPKFAKHQHVNARESPSTIPEPPEHIQGRCTHVHARGEGKGREGEKEGKGTPLTPLKGGDVAKPRRRDQRWHEYRWYLEQRQKGVDNDRMEMRVVDGKAQYRMKS